MKKSSVLSPQSSGRAAGEVMRCRVYPDRKSRYYTCVVFATLKAAQAYYRTIRPVAERSASRGWAAVVSPCRTIVCKNGRAKKRQSLGHILFHAGRVGGGVQAHEMVHAALNFMREDGRYDLALLADVNDGKAGHEVEEALATYCGDLARQFNNALCNRKWEVIELHYPKGVRGNRVRGMRLKA